MTFRTGLSCGIALGALLAGPGWATAADFTVESGAVVGPQVLTDPGDVGLIEAGGTINALATVGVSMNNVDQSVINAGTITTSGDMVHGIFSFSTGASILNDGEIFIGGVSAYGIASGGNDARVENGGTITTLEGGAFGIGSTGTNARINSSGDITTSGLAAHGIRSIGAEARIDNSGNIATSGDAAHGIHSQGSNTRIGNSGDITTSGIFAYGIIAADARIHNDGNITTSGVAANGILSSGANAEVRNSGRIATSGERAHVIGSNADNVRIDNSGELTASGAGAHGIVSEGAGADIANSGRIATSDSSNGIHSSGADARITNSGSISAAVGIYSTGANAVITNSGDIAMWGRGIVSDGDYAEIVNTGTISVTGVTTHAIVASGFAASITNSGVIRNTSVSNDNQPFGIRTYGADTIIRNSGDIIMTEGATFAILATGSNTEVINSGRIISETTGAAVFVTGDRATLTLLSGSVIQGTIRVGTPTTATLNVGPGLNTALTLMEVPDTINTYGAPLAVRGQLVAVVDPTGFAAQDEMLTDLTRAIGGAIDGRLNAARFGYAPVSASVTAYVEPDTRATAFGYGTGDVGTGGSGFWAAGIGAYRDQKADGIDGGFDSRLGGIMVGYDTEISAGTRVGGFLGASASRFRTDANSQEIDADSYYGGLYGGFTGQSYFVDVALTGGVTQQSSDRSIANNLVEGGIEQAKADYDGIFVSPSFTLGTTFEMADGGMFIPSVRARYAGLFLDGYDESGSAANLSVDDRDVNVFDLRAQLAYSLAARPLDNGNLHTAMRVGVDAAFADNSDVDAVLLGQGLNFSVSGDDTYRGFLGLDMVYRAEAGSSVFLGAEAGYDSGDTFTLDVRGGLRIPL